MNNQEGALRHVIVANEQVYLVTESNSDKSEQSVHTFKVLNDWQQEYKSYEGIPPHKMGGVLRDNADRLDYR